MIGLLLITGIVITYKNEDKDIIKEDIMQNHISNDVMYEQYKEINADYYGLLEFEKDFISEPIVQGNDNIFYQNMNIRKEKDSQGTVFVDCNYQNEELMVIYGHNVYYDKNAKFSKLEDLKNQGIYEKYNSFVIKKNNESSKYNISAVLEIDVRDSDFKYQQLSFLDQDDFDKWKLFVERKNIINNINEELKYGKEKVILQTCVKWKRYSLLIIIAQKVY